jgi:glycosyltransferase involved in cell wall biosynthesis
MPKIGIVIDWIGFSYGVLVDTYILQKTLGADVVWVSCIDEQRKYQASMFSAAYDKYLLDYDVLYFIQTEFFALLKDGQKRPGQKFVFMKNVDISLVTDNNTYYKNLHMVDVALARTNITIRHYEAMRKAFGYRYEIQYTKFTSLDYSSVYGKRRYFEIENPFKGKECVVIDKTDLLLEEIPHALPSPPGLLPSSVPLPLAPSSSTPLEYAFLSFGRKNLPHITKFWNRYRDQLPKLYIKSYCEDGVVTNAEMGDVAECRKNEKIEIIDRFIDDREKFELYNKCCFFINLSPEEGYGHNINEARSTGRVILVLNREPMNELVDNDCGIVMNTIEEGVSRALTLTKDQIEYKMKRTRQKYLEDTQYFVEHVKGGGR